MYFVIEIPFSFQRRRECILIFPSVKPLLRVSILLGSHDLEYYNLGPRDPSPHKEKISGKLGAPPPNSLEHPCGLGQKETLSSMKLYYAV